MNEAETYYNNMDMEGIFVLDTEESLKAEANKHAERCFGSNEPLRKILDDLQDEMLAAKSSLDKEKDNINWQGFNNSMKPAPRNSSQEQPMSLWQKATNLLGFSNPVPIRNSSATIGPPSSFNIPFSPPSFVPQPEATKDPRVALYKGTDGEIVGTTTNTKGDHYDPIEVIHFDCLSAEESIHYKYCYTEDVKHWPKCNQQCIRCQKGFL